MFRTDRLRWRASDEMVRPKSDARCAWRHELGNLGGAPNRGKPAPYEEELTMKPSAEQSLESLRQALQPLTAEYVVKGRMVELRVYDAPNIDPYIVLLPLSKLENMRGISQVVLEARQYLAVSTARSKKLASSDD